MDAVFHKRFEEPVQQRRRGPYLGLLTRYTLREIAVPAVMAIAIIGFVGVANELRERRGALPLEFVSSWDITRLAFYFSPTLAAYIIPITYMMGILLAFGRLSQNNEITAMKAAGIPLKRMVLPVIGVGLVLSALSFVLMDRVQPWAAAQANHILYVELPERITLEILPTGSVQEIGDWRVYFGGRDPETKTLKDIVIREPRKDGEWVFYADEARFVDSPQGAYLVLSEGHIIRPQQKGDVARVTIRDFKIAVPEALRRAAPSQRHTLTLRDLYAKERDVAKIQAAAPSKSNTEDLRKTRTEIADRFTLPLACLAVSFLAAPLAVRAPRSGRSYSFALGFVIIFVYYLMRMLLEPTDLVSLADAILRGAAPNLVLCLAGVAALWRVDRV